MALTRFRIRRDTAANWATNNPVLKLGEPALERDTLKAKYGDGVTAWNALPYATVSPASPTFTGTTTVAGLRSSGTVFFCIESAPTNLPTGRTGQGLEFWNNGVQSYNRTAGAYGSFTIDASTINIRPGGTSKLLADTTQVTIGGSAKLPPYTVAGVPSAATHGGGSLIYITNESGGAVPAFSDGTNWRRVTDRAIIS